MGFLPPSPGHEAGPFSTFSTMLSLWHLALFTLATFNGAEAYIPALPTNDTQAAIEGGLNVTDVSKLHLQWYSNGFVCQLTFLLRLVVPVLTNYQVLLGECLLSAGGK